MVPPLHQNLDPANGREFIELLVDLVEGDDIAVGILLGSVKGAELAVDVADIRVVDVPVDDVGDDIVPLAPVGPGQRQLAAVIGQCPQLLKRQAIELQRLLRRDALPLDHAIDQGFGCGDCGHDCSLKAED